MLSACFEGRNKGKIRAGVAHYSSIPRELVVVLS